MVNIAVMFLIAVSGFLMAISYYIMSTLETAFRSVDCLIPQNIYFTTCQEWFNMALYPVLELKSLFIFASYFFIFGVVFGLSLWALEPKTSSIIGCSYNQFYNNWLFSNRDRKYLQIINI